MKNQELGNAIWNATQPLWGDLKSHEFEKYVLPFLFLYGVSEKYEKSVKKELNQEGSFSDWFAKASEEDQKLLEDQMKRKIGFFLKPSCLWSSLAKESESTDFLSNLKECVSSFEETFEGLFTDFDLNTTKLGKTEQQRNETLSAVFRALDKSLSEFSNQKDTLGDAYEFLVNKFMSVVGQGAGEYYTPQEISTVLSRIVTNGKKKLRNLLDFTCGSGSLLLNACRQIGTENIGKIYGQEKNFTTYNLARMNMLLHGVSVAQMNLYRGDTIANEWPLFKEYDPSNKIELEAIVSNPPFSLRWEREKYQYDPRFVNYGLPANSAADFAFLLHGLHHLSEDGTMAIVLPHGVLFRGGAEQKIRANLLQDNHIDAVIGLPFNLFRFTGIAVCVIVLKKNRKKEEGVLIINAAEEFEKGKKQNRLRDEDVDKIMQTYQERREEEFYSRRVSFSEIQENDFCLNITRYVSTVKPEEPIDIEKAIEEVNEAEKKCQEAKAKLNVFLKELGLKELI